MNQLKTVMLLAALGALLVVLGGYLGGKNGATIALVIALVMNVGSYWFSDRIVLSIPCPGSYRIRSARSLSHDSESCAKRRYPHAQSLYYS